jgi:hypothetical protein
MRSPVRRSRGLSTKRSCGEGRKLAGLASFPPPPAKPFSISLRRRRKRQFGEFRSVMTSMEGTCAVLKRSVGVKEFPRSENCDQAGRAATE